MKIERPKLIAIVGGSGSGKSWLADHLHKSLGATAARVSLDDFYRVHPRMSAAARAKINFDHPREIDWPLFETAIRNFQKGRAVRAPHYDFTTHTRQENHKLWLPRPLVLVDGLWLLWQRSIRSLFDLTIFIESPTLLRLERRAARDVIERGRSLSSVREQFWKTVVPMHDLYVEPQINHADLVLKQPLSAADVNHALQTVKKLLPEKASLKRRGDSSRYVLSQPSEIFIGGALSARLSEMPYYAFAH